MFYKFELLNSSGAVCCRRPCDSRDEAKREGVSELNARCLGTGVVRLIECNMAERWLTEVFAYEDGKEVAHHRGRKKLPLINGM